MFPILKTLKSFKEAKLGKYVFFNLLIATATILAFIYGVISLKDRIFEINNEWIKSVSDGILSVIIIWFLLPSIIPLISGFFEEIIIKKVEQRYYPDDVNETQRATLWPDLLHDIKFTLISLGLNILIIPWYFFGIGFLMSIILNSYLLGREFFDSAAGYHLGKKEAGKLRKKHSFTVYLGGLSLTLITLIPVFNLFIPIIAVVWMVHSFHYIKLKQKTIELKQEKKEEAKRIKKEEKALKKANKH